MLSKLEASDASEHMLDEWDQRHRAFHSAIAAGCGSHYLLQMRAEAYLTSRPATALFGYVKTVLSVEMLEKINISSITR